MILFKRFNVFLSFLIRLIVIFESFDTSQGNLNLSIPAKEGLAKIHHCDKTMAYKQAFIHVNSEIRYKSKGVNQRITRKEKKILTYS